MNKKSRHGPHGLEPLDPHELEKWMDRYETIRLWRHLLSVRDFYRSEQGNADVFELTVETFRRAKALIVHLLKRPHRDD